ncbi:Ribosomal protein L22 [Glarea lozoyensis ATCC 20868]|uniref:Ribosomal protein L22 n=2 Tax=Glarea lozoyensis TaxID=101852 RepID=S3D9E4_GLAL2|nr:Ribosomal protein L22 [Glarea lozoyensis ATCC 20868]EHK98505.1 putative 54S ribosomal protein L22, mitochondrial [Glarea lozoyensis 74030]EPE28616.1 Ribosomal protein L22 [Glarea lozoyensis ATCC 20868]
MSLNLPIRRAACSAPQTCHPPRQLVIHRLSPFSQRRTFIGRWFRDKDDEKAVPKATNPKERLAASFLKEKPSKPKMNFGGLSKSSILEDESVVGKPDEKSSGKPVDYEKDIMKVLPRNPESMKAALNPNPEARIRWQQKMAIREVRKRGRLTKRQILKRTERELSSKSHSIKTSVKKLVPLAKQITGKTVADAIIQMRFSVKKAAKDVKEHLEHAKNEAIVKRGMSLGVPDGDHFSPLHIQTKDKKTVRVNDPTTLFIEQAWVGRSAYGRSLDYRARGRVNVMKNPTTTLTVVLKEEKTRMREHEERQQKIRNRKTWVQLPNRPITAQRQYYSW